jgi:hypothetical protein
LLGFSFGLCPDFSAKNREIPRIWEDLARSQNVKIRQDLARSQNVTRGGKMSSFEFWESCSISKKLSILEGKFLISGFILRESQELLQLLKSGKSFKIVCEFVESNF